MTCPKCGRVHADQIAPKAWEEYCETLPEVDGQQYKCVVK